MEAKSAIALLILSFAVIDAIITMLFYWSISFQIVQQVETEKNRAASIQKVNGLYFEPGNNGISLTSRL
jgi:hypothetical protein